MARKNNVVAILVVALLIVGVPTIKIEAATAAQPPKIITTLRGGNLKSSLKLDWLPMMQKLATGKVPGDKYTWTFKESPLYTEADDWLEADFELRKRVLNTIQEPSELCEAVRELPIGTFNIGRLEAKTEASTIKDAKGVHYKVALVEYGVKEWATPYGAQCSRAEALRCYNQCNKKIKMVVKKLKATRYKGKPLTKALKFKFIHDWLIASVDYEDKGYMEGKISLENLIKDSSLFNEFGAMVDGKAVCQGFSYAFKAICDEYNRRSSDKLVCDVAYDGEHAWNRVKLHGQWYVVDLTESEGGKYDFVLPEAPCFFVSEGSHGRLYYETQSGIKARARSKKYEWAIWPTFKKSLKECTVSLKYPNKVYKYKGKQVIPEVVVRYGKNVIPSVAYRVVRTDHKKTGVATFKVVPSKNCRLLKGSLAGPSFKIKKRRPKK